MDTVSAIMDYESGELDEDGFLDLFAELIRAGTVWGLQGSYGRTAASLIDVGLITPDGTINAEKVNELRALDSGA